MGKFSDQLGLFYYFRKSAIFGEILSLQVVLLLVKFQEEIGLFQAPDIWPNNTKKRGLVQGKKGARGQGPGARD